MPKDEIPEIPDIPAEADDKTLLNLFGGNKATLEEFKRFRDKEKQREARREIEEVVSDLLENDLREENEAALEGMNVVYRKAWTMACKELKYDEAEFPSKY